jgi:hypothetical protein
MHRLYSPRVRRLHQAAARAMTYPVGWLDIS